MITLDNINGLASRLAAIKREVLKECPTKKVLLDNIENNTQIGLLVINFVESLCTSKEEEIKNLSDFITILYGEE